MTSGHGTTTSSRALNALHETTRDAHGFPTTTKSTSIKDDGFGSASVNVWSTSQKDEFFPSNSDFAFVTADSISEKKLRIHLKIPSFRMPMLILLDEEEKLANSDANIMVLQHRRDHQEHDDEEDKDGVRHAFPSSPVKSIESIEEKEEEELDLMVPSVPEMSGHTAVNDIEEEEEVNPVSSQRPMSSYSRGIMKYQRSEEKPYNNIPDEYQRPKGDTSSYRQQQYQQLTQR